MKHRYMALTWKNFKNIMLGERSHIPKITYYMIPVIWNVEKSKIYRNRKQINVCLGLKVRKESDYKWARGGFPGGAVVENLPANAGDTGSSPGLGRSHMPRSSWVREPQLLSLRVWSLCPATGGATIVKGPRTAMKSGPCTAMKSGPHLPQLEKALTRTEDPTQSKINK